MTKNEEQILQGIREILAKNPLEKTSTIAGLLGKSERMIYTTVHKSETNMDALREEALEKHWKPKHA